MNGVPGLDAVLDAFTIEQSHDRPTLERYIQQFPRYAQELVDLCFELNRELETPRPTLTDQEATRIASWWKDYASATIVDPFASKSTNDLREAALTLRVPRQVLAAFRERAVMAASVPARFMQDVANALRVRTRDLVVWLELPIAEAARSYKATDRPVAGSKVTLEQILIDAEVPEARKNEILSSR